LREPPPDVLTFSRIPAGVTGIPRLREWDAVVLVDVPELAGSALGEIELLVPAEGALAVRATEPVPREAVDRLVAELDGRIDRPYEALAVRQDDRRFTAGARALAGGESVDLPADLPASSLEVVLTPEGELQASADGEEIDPAAAAQFESALALLERHGRARFESFVVRADKADGGRWQLTVDPL
jgi:hypothetical protein